MTPEEADVRARSGREAMVQHLRYDGRLSVADCVSLAVIGHHGVRAVDSFDDDFDRVKGLRRIC